MSLQIIPEKQATGWENIHKRCTQGQQGGSWRRQSVEAGAVLTAMKRDKQSGQGVTGR